MDGIVEVRIRYAEFGKGASLTDWPAADLAGLIALVESWGVHAEKQGPFTEHFYGQFVVEDNRAYFEIVVGAEE
jgi:hypothetical protein